MNNINLADFDVDGAIGEQAYAVEGDTRLSFLKKAGLTGGAALSGGAILSALTPGIAGAAGTRPPAKFGKGDIGILNYALTLEYLERAFYQEAADKGQISDPATAEFLKLVLRDEKAHVAFLKKALGSKAVKSPKFDFQGIPSVEAKFKKTAAVLENTGVRAYFGQAGNISNPAYLKAAASILTIEARHAGIIGFLNNSASSTSSTPNGAFDKPASAAAILKAVTATKFIVG